MKKLVLIFVLLFSVTVFAKGQTFSKKYKLDSKAAVITSIFSTDSCFYATGIIADSINSNSTGNSFIKFDLEGNIIFNKKLSDPNKSYETWRGTLQFMPNGDFVTSGYSSDSTGLTMIIISYNSEGDTTSLNEYLSPFWDEDQFYVPMDMIINQDNHITLLNRLTDNLGTSYSELLILDHDGETKLSKIYTHELRERSESIIQDSDGGYILGIFILNPVLSVGNITAKTKIIKVDSLGEIQWEYFSPEGQLHRGATAMVKAGNDNGLIVASGLGIEVPINSSASNLYFKNYVFKLDENQNIEWEVDYSHLDTGLSDRTQFYKIRDVGDGYVIGGTNWDSKLPAYNDGYLVKISYNGERIWERKFHIIVPDEFPVIHEFYDLKITSDSGFIMVGQVFDFGNTLQPQEGWIVKVDQYGCLIPGCNLEVSANELTLFPKIILEPYPNPTSDILNIYFKHASPTNGIFRILDLNGKVLLQFDANKNDTTYLIGLDNFSSGVYFLQYLENKFILKTKQIIIQK